MIVILVAAFCVGESVTALGWMLYNGLLTGNSEMRLETALLTVGQLSLLAVGLGILTWARRKRIAFVSRGALVLTYFTVTLTAAVSLAIFAILSTGNPPTPVEAGSKPEEMTVARPRTSPKPPTEAKPSSLSDSPRR